MGPSRKPLQRLQVAKEQRTKSQQQLLLTKSDGLIKITASIENEDSKKKTLDTDQKAGNIQISQQKESIPSDVENNLNQVESTVDPDATVEAPVEKKPPHLVPRPLATDDVSRKDLIDWMTADSPPESCWKELAEQRRLALEEALSENEELVEQLEAKNREIDQLQEKVESQNATISSLREKINEDANEIDILKVMANEAERLTNILNDLLDEHSTETDD